MLFLQRTGGYRLCQQPKPDSDGLFPALEANRDRPYAPGVWDGGFRLRVYGVKAHKPHEALNSFAINFIAQSLQVISHGSTPVDRRLEILFIYETHQLKILFTDFFALVIK